MNGFPAKELKDFLNLNTECTNYKTHHKVITVREGPQCHRILLQQENSNIKNCQVAISNNLMLQS